MVLEVHSSDDEGQAIQINWVEPNNISIPSIFDLVSFNEVGLAVVVDPGGREIVTLTRES